MDKTKRNILSFKDFVLNEIYVQNAEQAVDIIYKEKDKQNRDKIVREIADEYFSDDLIFGRLQLSLNSEGQDVSVLQSILKGLGYLPSSYVITYKLDDVTFQAIEKFAKLNNIVVNKSQPIPIEIVKLAMEFDSSKYEEPEIKQKGKVVTEPTTPTSVPSSISMPPSSVTKGEGVRKGIDYPSAELEKNAVLSVQYSKSRDGDKSLSPNFKVRDFACNDGSDIILINPHIVELLEKIKAHFGKPLRLNSGYRTPTYNKKVGGRKKSQHMFGNAADFRIDGVRPSEVSSWLKTFHTGGIGTYPSFTHVDVRNLIGWKSATW